ncbi:FbpB family small basic protein [Bacillus sp. Marseille-P3661]|uniref:FbpB family small basic protein n=1 Tax=Bacillus sp. Marseille-P3661 TaxID=1936234 RepID=UPI0027E4CAFC|nr:FbpB family small basic protein [Bacillus sp. Marseille-P3661]
METIKAKKFNFKELVEANKESLLQDKEALEKIEKKIEDKAIQNDKKLVRS